jgi:hypothetical protein
MIGGNDGLREDPKFYAASCGEFNPLASLEIESME